MGVDVTEVDELVRFTASATPTAVVQDLIAIIYLDPAVAIEAGERMARVGEQILREQARRAGVQLERQAVR